MLEAMTDNSLGAYKRAIAEHGLDGPFPWEGERPPWFIVDVGMTEVRRISFLRLMRGDDDETTINHETDSAGVATASLPFLVVRDEL